MIRNDQQVGYLPGFGGRGYGYENAPGLRQQGTYLLGERCDLQQGFQCLPPGYSNQGCGGGYQAGYQAAITQLHLQMQMQFLLMQGGANRSQSYQYPPLQENQDPCTGLDNSFQQCMPPDNQSLKLQEQMRRRQQRLEDRIKHLEEELAKQEAAPKPVAADPKPATKPVAADPKPATKPVAADPKPATTDNKAKPTEATPAVAPAKSSQQIHAERVEKVTQDLLKSGKSLNAEQIKNTALAAGLQPWEADGLVTCLKDSHGTVGDFTDAQQKDMLAVWSKASTSTGSIQELAQTLTSYSWAEGTKHTNMSQDVFNCLAFAAGSPKGYEQLRDSLGSINGWGWGGVNFDKADVRKNLQDWSAPTVAAPTAAEGAAPGKSAAEIHAARVDKVRQDLMKSGKSLDANGIKQLVASAGLESWEADGLITCLDDSHGTVGDFTTPEQQDMLNVWSMASKSGGDSHKFAQSLISYSWLEGTKHTYMSRDAFNALARAGGTRDSEDVANALGSISGWGWGGVNFDRADVRENLNRR